MPKRLAIIGGGAAGFFAAIRAAELDPRAEVWLFEKSPEFLAKVSISGGGRCNVTHHCFDVDRLVQNYPRGGRELIGPFHRFQPRDTVAWFESRGVMLKTEEDGRMFPVTDRSSSIVECLMREAERVGVRLRRSLGAREIQRDTQGKFAITFSSGECMRADRVLLATGGNKATAGYRLAAALGHTIVPPVPSLFTFNVPDPTLHELAGISAPHAAIRVEGMKLEQRGPVLITHWGLSGPAALRISAWGARAFAETAYRADLSVSWQCEDAGQRLAQIAEARQKHASRSVGSTPLIRVPARLWQWLLARAGVPRDRPWNQVSKTDAARIADEIDQCRIRMDGKSMFKDEFVTCGGVSLKEVDFKTMQSKVCPGLYFAGELLDIDAVTGGFNFQAAWTTGWIAGESMASSS